MKKRKLIPVIIFCCSLTSLSVPAFATSFSTNANYLFGAHAGSMTGENSTSITVSQKGTRNADVNTNAQADSNGKLISTSSAGFWTSSPDPMNPIFNPVEFSVSSSASWSETYTAPFDGLYSWDLSIPKASLLVQRPDLRVEPEYWFYDDKGLLPAVISAQKDITAEIGGEILVNGNTAGDYGASYSANDIGSVKTTGLMPEGIFWIDPIDYSESVTWENLLISVDLGHFNQGDDISITMLLSSSIFGTGFENYGFARIEDPGNLQGSLRGAPIPEPTTLLLFGTGLTVLAGFRKKRKIPER